MYKFNLATPRKKRSRTPCFAGRLDRQPKTGLKAGFSVVADQRPLPMATWYGVE